jgi:hypothetical protein
MMSKLVLRVLCKPSNKSVAKPVAVFFTATMAKASSLSAGSIVDIICGGKDCCLVMLL